MNQESLLERQTRPSWNPISSEHGAMDAELIRVTSDLDPARGGRTQRQTTPGGPGQKNPTNRSRGPTRLCLRELSSGASSFGRPRSRPAGRRAPRVSEAWSPSAVSSGGQLRRLRRSSPAINPSGHFEPSRRRHAPKACRPPARRDRRLGARDALGKEVAVRGAFVGASSMYL